MTPSHHLAPTQDERDLVVDGLFELTITYVEDEEKREQCKVLAAQLGGDADGMFYGASPPELRR